MSGQTRKTPTGQDDDGRKFEDESPYEKIDLKEGSHKKIYYYLYYLYLYPNYHYYYLELRYDSTWSMS